MEVHHHAHHDGPKNWKSYLREFGMLFLAVFCGSLAEYQLEHKIEKDRERQFIESMVADMKVDQGKIEDVAAFCEKQAMAFDTILQMAYTKPLNERNLRTLYRLQSRYAGTRYLMAFSKRTITQLKNSGGLRLIRNKPASDTITLYDQACETIESQGSYIENVRMGKINDLSVQLFDYAYFTPTTAPQSAGRPVPLKLLSTDPQLLRQYANVMLQAKYSLLNYVRMMRALEKAIPPKIAFLEEKYDL
jgi:hypothetical protein